MALDDGGNVTREEAIEIVGRCEGYGPIHDPNHPEWAEATILLDGHFTADELEAIAVMMRTAPTKGTDQ